MALQRRVRREQLRLSLVTRAAACSFMRDLTSGFCRAVNERSDELQRYRQEQRCPQARSNRESAFVRYREGGSLCSLKVVVDIYGVTSRLEETRDQLAPSDDDDAILGTCSLQATRA